MVSCPLVCRFGSFRTGVKLIERQLSMGKALGSTQHCSKPASKRMSWRLESYTVFVGFLAFQHCCPQKASGDASQGESSAVPQVVCLFGLIFTFRICDAATIHCLLEQELAHAVNACSHALNKANPRFPEVRI